MSVIKVKAFIYRYFGVYLAHREENNYLRSKEFWDSFMKAATSPENDMSPRSIQGLLVGTWNVDRGFYRGMSRFWLKRPRLLFGPLNWICVLFSTVVWDLRQIFKK